MNYEEILNIIKDYAEIIIPLVAYVVGGIFALKQIAIALSNMITALKESNAKTEKSTKEIKAENEQLRNQMKLTCKENAETRRELQSLINRIDRIGGTADEQGN